jgi:hypothetical protein
LAGKRTQNLRAILLLHLFNKRVCPTKNEPQQQGISYLDREREGVGERGMWAGQQTGIFKVRLGLGEIEGRRGYRQRDRADNKIPNKAQIV